MKLHKFDLQDQKKIEDTEKDLGLNTTAGISNCRNKLCENVGIMEESHFAKRHMNYAARSSSNAEDQHKCVLIKEGFSASQKLTDWSSPFPRLTIKSQE
jgi:hypothetical protein